LTPTAGAADVPRVLLRSPWGGPWLDCSAPVAVFETRRPDEVRECLAAVDREVRRTGATAAGFVAYEAAEAFGLPVLPLPDNEFPLVWFGLFTADRIEKRQTFPRGDRIHAAPDWRASLTHDAYLDGVRRIRERIEAGDTYQINYTWRLRSTFAGEPLSLFAELDEAQRGRWSAFIDVGRHAICSASPELFFTLDRGRIECRPMKGTMPRGRWSADDLRHAAALAASPKDRAENVMVVDMTRNDIGRIARVGSVQAPSLFEVERYPGQWQMVSRVVGDVERPALDTLFAALFPSGSVTGAPKHRSMAIIAAVEGEPRGIYTGAIGLFDGERAHFNVAIRTVHVDRAAGRADFGVGSGIVWDSVDRDEYDECLVKASILTRREPAFDLLESIGWTPDEGFVLLAAHIDRLKASADYFGFVMPETAALHSALERAVAGFGGPAKVRLLLSRAGELHCTADPLTPKPVRLRAALAANPVDAASVLLYHKTTARRVYDEARASRPDADAVILWNTRGEITEGAEANVVVEIEGRKVTPPLECGLLPGVKRAALLAAGEIQERRIGIDELRAAQAIWLINSVRGWMAAALDADHSSSRSRSL
jgi:para-aminobenzoate synthetase/4-amino-4-deoxychorismate lyase